MTARHFIVFSIALFASAACFAQAAGNIEPDLAPLVRLYETDRADLQKFYDLPADSAKLTRMQQLNESWSNRLRETRFDSLSPQGKIDHILLRSHWEHERAQHELERQRMDEMSALLPFCGTILELENDRRSMKRVDPRAAAARLAEIPGQIKVVRERLDASRATSQPAAASQPALRVAPTVALRAAAVVAELRKTLDAWAAFHDGFDPEFSWWTKQPRAAAKRALDDYAKYLRETIAGVKGKPDDPLIGDPIGEAALLADLRHEFIAYSPAELIDIAERDLAWCEAEMKRAAAEMGLADDWKAALEQVKQDHVAPGEQAQLVRDQAREAIELLKRDDLVTIPPLCEETWRLEMISQKRQQVLPFAVYGGQHMAVAYPTDSFTHEDKLMSMRGNNRHFTRLVTPHELIPGHHLQLFMANRVNAHRRLFRTPFFVEGWALYWEMRLWELGWARSPQERIGMLFWRMHRGARVIVSLKFHLGQMSPQEMIDFLVDRVGHERFGATSEVRRFIGGQYSPLYQCAYLIGGLQIRALHEELVKSGKMTDKQFNDTLLTYNSIPIELIRASMTGSPIDHDFTASWRFAK